MQLNLDFKNENKMKIKKHYYDGWINQRQINGEFMKYLKAD